MWLRKKLGQEAILTCPRDGSRMKKLRKEDVVIDVCPSCNGLWLDDLEIEKLIGKHTATQHTGTPHEKKRGKKK